MRNCPYCLASQADSKDHIFPQFLGGTQTIPACKRCNDRFGHTFEGRVAKELSPLIVALSTSGYNHPKVVSHKRAWTDPETGIDYDLNSAKTAVPTKAYLTTREGKVVSFLASPGEAQAQARKLRAKGKKVEIFESSTVTQGPFPPMHPFRFNVGAEFRKLATKMCVAAAKQILQDEFELPAEHREFLLAENPAPSSVQMLTRRCDALDALRPPLAHVVYIQADPDTGKSFGVVQIFGGALQFYVPLMQNYSGGKMAALATLDVVAFREDFKRIPSLGLDEPPKFVAQEEMNAYYKGWGENLNGQVHAAFGKNVLLVNPLPKQSFSPVSALLPLLWIEHQVRISVSIHLVPDSVPQTDVRFPNDPRQWIISPDLGKTQLKVFDGFVSRWNGGMIPRSVGSKHEYIPEEIQPGVRLCFENGFSCPITLFKIEYEVKPHAWLGSIQVTTDSRELDWNEGSLQTKLRIAQEQIPKSRDPSWALVEDLDKCRQSLDISLTMEFWDLSPDLLSFDDLSIGSFDAPETASPMS